MDPDNAIVQLCVQGMKDEAAGRLDEAHACFQQVWDAHADDFEACIAAHYLARHQPTPADALAWNQRALRHADAVADERVRGFHPSLLLNLAHSHEQLGDRDEARRFYDLAAAASAALPDDRYGGIVRQGIENGRARVG